MTQSDVLIDSYRAAQKLQNDAGPSELTRRRILAHAEQLANNRPDKDNVISSEITTDFIAEQAIDTLPANDSRWKIRALGSVAVFGIAGLLMLQLSREVPDEFLPKANPPVSAERLAESATSTVAESESKFAADQSVRAPVQAPAAPEASPTAYAVPSATPAPAAAPTSAPLPEQRAKKSESASRDDLEISVAKAPKLQNGSSAEARADNAAELTHSFAPPPSAASSAAVAASSSAPAPTSASAAVADAAKLSRSAPVAPSAKANVTINANAKLFIAIQTKDAAALKLALEGGDDKNAKNADGTPALSVCIQSEQLNLVRLLIAAGADVNALDARGVSALTHARKLGFAEIATLLLNSGAK